MTDYIVTRTVLGLQMLRVDVDNRPEYTTARKLAEYFPVAGKLPLIEVWCPQTIRARFWRWVLGG